MTREVGFARSAACRRLRPPRSTRPVPRCSAIEQLADWLGVTDRFIRRLVAERRIPFLKIGKFIRFDPAEIEPWLDSQCVAER